MWYSDISNISDSQVKSNTIKFNICCFSAKHTTLRLGIGIICQSRVTCLPTDCCFSELALWKCNSVCWSSTKQQHQHHIEFVLTWLNWKLAHLALTTNISLIWRWVGIHVYGYTSYCGIQTSMIILQTYQE